MRTRLLHLLASGLLSLAAHAADTGMLYVKSAPPGAGVLVDGVDRGKTPVLLRDLPPGDLTLKLVLPGAPVTLVTARVVAGEVKRVDVKLALPRASLTVITEPLEADIHVDRLARGPSPVTVGDLAAGEHEVISILDGYERAVRRVSLGAGEKQTLEIKLTPLGSGAEVPDAPPPAPTMDGPAAVVSERLTSCLTEFEKLLERRGYAEAKRLVLERSRDDAYAGEVDQLRAAARVAAALERRRKSIRDRLSKRIGEVVTLDTRAGRRKGTLLDVTERNLAVETEIAVGGRAVGSSRFVVEWQDLSHEQSESLAGDWRPAGSVGHIAEAFLALLRDAYADGLAAVEATEGHPLAPYLRVRLAQLPSAPKAEGRPLGSETQKSVGAGDTQDLPRGLVGWWQFEELSGNTARDSSHNANHATLMGPARAKGWIGHALAFDGKDDYATATPNGVPPSGSPVTVAFFFYVPHRPKPGGRCAVSLLDEGASTGLHCGFLGGNSNRIGMWKWGGHWLLSVTRPFTGSWGHYTYTYDGRTHVLYLNGRAVDRSTGNPDVGPYANVVFGRAYSRGNYLRGLLDDIRIYDRALSAAEVKTLATSKQTRE